MKLVEQKNVQFVPLGLIMESMKEAKRIHGILKNYFHSYETASEDPLYEVYLKLTKIIE